MYALIGRAVVWSALIVAAGYGAVGLYVFIRLFFAYCQCDGALNALGF